MNIENLISEARLSTFLKHTNNKSHAFELHNITLQIGFSLGAMIALIEIGLRNKTDHQLRKDFGDEDWLRNHTHLKLKKREIIKDREKNAINRAIYYARTRTQIQETHNQILVHTTLFLWKRLYSQGYKKTLWDRSLKHVFPDKSVTQCAVAYHLEVIYGARNRIAHHEPIYDYQLDKTFKSIQFIRKELGREANETNSDFMEFSEKQNNKLCSDYAEFKKQWKLITSQANTQ